MSINASRARYVPVEKGLQYQAAADRTPGLHRGNGPRLRQRNRRPASSPLDLSEVLGTGYAATTPFMLARYARIRKGETLACTLAASGELWVVLARQGSPSALRQRDLDLVRDGDAGAPRRRWFGLAGR